MGVENEALQRHLPLYLSQYMSKQLKKAGVDVQSSRLVSQLQRSDELEDASSETVEQRPVTMSLMGWEKETLDVDYVVLASTHIKPNRDAFIHQTGLEVDLQNGGVVVNAAMEAIGGLYVAGNLASYYDSSLGRQRVDRYEHAINSGLIAGNNMASSRIGGPQKMYINSPAFRSRMPALGIECIGIGEIDSNLDTVGVWLAQRDEETKEIMERTVDSDFERGIVYYLRKGRVVGILLWNANDQLQKARQILASQLQTSDPSELQQAILMAPDDWIDVIVSSPN